MHAPDDRPERFILVRPLKSVARCSARHPGRGDFLSMIEETMSTMTIVFVLIILLFGFDSTGEVKTRRQHNHG
jgi:hypothetical protein